VRGDEVKAGVMSLLAMKLRCPAVPPKRVHRPHLTQRLNDGLESGRLITLISAPPGFGKTTCAAEWVSRLDLPVAWLSLERADDDPARSFAYLVAALQQIDQAVGREIEGIIHSGRLPPTEVITHSLANDILQLGCRFLLVLDDFQVIQERAIHEALASLIGNQPPNMHLVLLTREDPPLPLARVRANNKVTEIRAGDLRFTCREAESFLSEVMGLRLSPADVGVLDDKTEGWVAGLQLAGLSIRGRDDQSGFIARLSGSHRYILSYLTEEVLSQQSQDMQRFLLQTSILHRLNGELCDAVTGRTDSATLLERLVTANLFLIPLDDEQRWYRYHHLFIDLLRNLLNAHHRNQAAELHRRASRWYAHAGMPMEAFQHALDAADYALAVQLLEAHATGMMVQGYVKTVEGWLNAVPAEARLHSPKANLAFAWMHLMHGTFAQASPYLERLQRHFSGSQTDSEAPSLRAEWLALQSCLRSGQGDAAESLRLATQALEIAPEQDSYVQSLAYNGLASAHLLMGNYAHAVEVCRKAILHSRAASNLPSELLGTSILAQIALQHGQYHFALEIASSVAARLASSASLPPLSSVVYGALGQVYYQWHRFEQARTHLLRAIQLCILGGYTDGEIYYRTVFSRLLQMEGDREASSRELRKSMDLMQHGAPAWVRSEVVSELVRAYVAENGLPAAEAVLTEYGFSFRADDPDAQLAFDQTMTHEAGLLYNSALRVLLHRAQAQREPASLQRGIDLASRLISGALQAHYIPTALRTLLLRAQMFAALGDRQACLDDCARALEWAEAEGLVSLFVEEGRPIAEALAAVLKSNQVGFVQPAFVDSILAAFPDDDRCVAASPVPASGMAAPTDMIEPLSKRELQILGLIAEGCSNQQIAQRLFLSLHTVKKHISNIFAKLAADSRTLAVARARQSGLLQER